MKPKEVELYELFMTVLLGGWQEGDADPAGEPVVVECGVDCECPEGHCAYKLAEK